MSDLKITADGVVTLPQHILRHLGLPSGGDLVVEELAGGRLVLTRAKPTGKISDVFGMLKREGGPSLTIEEINESIAAGWAGEP